MVYTVREVLVEQVTVLVLLSAGVEESGAVLQTEPPHPLLDEVEVLVAVVVLLLQGAHVVSLRGTVGTFSFSLVYGSIDS